MFVSQRAACSERVCAASKREGGARRVQQPSAGLTLHTHTHHPPHTLHMRRHKTVLTGINGGVLLIRPCPAVEAHMLRLLNDRPKLRFTHGTAEQDFLTWCATLRPTLGRCSAPAASSQPASCAGAVAPAHGLAVGATCCATLPWPLAARTLLPVHLYFRHAARDTATSLS